MKLVRGAWELLVGVKDALVLLLLILFFGALATALSSRPGSKPIGTGALVLDGFMGGGPARGRAGVEMPYILPLCLFRHGQEA